MKPSSLLFLFFFIIQVSHSQNIDPYSEQFFSGTINRLEVTTSGGYISVKGGAERTSVKVFITGTDSKQLLTEAEIEERLKLHVLDIQKVNDKVVCVAKPKDERRIKNNQRLAIHFEIQTSEKTDADLKTSGGSIQLAGLDGKLLFSTSGGALILDHLKGEIKGATSGGSIDLDNSSGKIELATSGGSVLAKNSNGEIHLKSGGGSLELVNLEGTINGMTSGGSIKTEKIKGDLSIKTSGGSIRFKDFSGNLSGATSGGSIEGNVLSIKNELKLTTSAGSIRVDLPDTEGLDLELIGNKIESKLPFDSFSKKRSHTTQINGGGKKVSLTTSSGNIFLD